jgi:hypothetical protein
MGHIKVIHTKKMNICTQKKRCVNTSLQILVLKQGSGEEFFFKVIPNFLGKKCKCMWGNFSTILHDNLH